MKLDNIDIGKLSLADVPKFKECPCELCDDGCFEHSGNEHYPGCRRRFPQRNKTTKSAHFPSTHYRSTYLAADANQDALAERRFPCPPAPDNPIPTSFKNVPMSNKSSQREDYQAPPAGTLKQSMIYPQRSAEYSNLSRSVPMETRSLYQSEFVKKSAVPVSVHVNEDSQINLTEPTATMNSQTMTRAHFQSWKSAPAYPFTEMPSVAGHIMFPGSNRDFHTTSGSNFVSYEGVSKIKPVNRMEPPTNIGVLGGKMDLRTNYRVDYLAPDHNSVKPEKKPIGEPKVYVKPPMKSISQTSFDFRAYPTQRRRSLIMAEPFQSQINLGNARANVEGESLYRVDYPGHDTSQHPPQAPILPKDEKKPYVPPNIKMDTVTITQRDFQPIDLKTLPKIRVLPVHSSLSLDEYSPMNSMTTTRYHFQAYEPVGGNRRFGELVPNLYITPSEKFHSTTTTGEAFQGRNGPPARPIVNEMQSIHNYGKQDHRTNYRVDYQPHGLSICAAKAFKIAKKKEPVSTQ